METLAHIPLSDIRRPTICIRPVRRASPEYVELVESIRTDGVLQSLLLRPVHCVGCSQDVCAGPSCTVDKVKHKYEPVEGNHRYTAAKEAGRFEVPAIIREMSDREVLVLQLKCQSIRPETFSFEYARRLKLLMEDGMSIDQLSAEIDKSPDWIRKQLYLNRLCEKARPLVEDGSINVKSALALANLPTKLQVPLIQEAIELNAGDFVSRANSMRRDYDAFLIGQKEEDRKDGVLPPSLRATNTLKRESIEPKHAAKVLEASGAETPLDGWLACLAWAFKLDPITIEKRRNKEKVNVEYAAATREEYYQMNRDMIKKFVKPQSRTGDRHGK